MGAVGVDTDRDKVYTYATDDALTKKMIMDVSNKSYVMLETRKLAVKVIINMQILVILQEL